MDDEFAPLQFLRDMNEMLCLELGQCVDMLVDLSLATESHARLMCICTRLTRLMENLKSAAAFQTGNIVTEYHTEEFTFYVDLDESDESDDSDEDVPDETPTVISLIDGMELVAFSSAGGAAPGAAVASDDSCPVCQEPFSTAQQVRQLKGCRHIYCDGCILQWVFDRDHNNNSCPKCRAPIASSVASAASAASASSNDT